MARKNNTFGVLSIYIQHQNGTSFEQKMSILLHVLTEYGGLDSQATHKRVQAHVSDIVEKGTVNLNKSIVSFYDEMLELAKQTKDSFIQPVTKTTDNQTETHVPSNTSNQPNQLNKAYELATEADTTIALDIKPDVALDDDYEKYEDNLEPYQMMCDMDDTIDEYEQATPVGVPKKTPQSLQRIFINPYFENDEFGGYRVRIPFYEQTRTGSNEVFYKWFRFFRNRFKLRNVTNNSNATGRLIKQHASEPFDDTLFTPDVLNHTANDEFNHAETRNDNATYEWLI